MDLLITEKPGKSKKGKGDGWNQQVGVNQQILSFGGMGGFNKVLKDKIT